METIAVCSTKNECPYMLEWVSYYKIIGFDRILVVTNNNSDQTIPLYERIKAKYDWFDFIEHSIDTDDVSPQKQGYGLVLKWFAEKGFTGYAGVFDADEFLCIANGLDVKGYVKKHPDADCISLNWRIFGSSGHTTRPNDLVIASYRHCAEETFRQHRTLKSIFKVDGNLKNFNPHFPRYLDRGKRVYVQDDGSRFHIRDKANSRVISYKGAWVNHYLTKYKDEFLLKNNRGEGARNRRESGERNKYNEDYFDRMDRNEVTMEFDAVLVEKTRRLAEEIYQACDLRQIAEPAYFGLEQPDAR